MIKTLVKGLDVREWDIVGGLLHMGSEFGGRRVCDDFDLAPYVPDIQHRRALMQEYHHWNGDPEEFNPDGSYEGCHAFMLAGFYAEKRLYYPQELKDWEFPLIAGLLRHEASSFSWQATGFSREMASCMMDLANKIYPGPDQEKIDIQRALSQLAEIDEMIRQRSVQQHKPEVYDPFLSLVHQKEGLREYIQQQTGQEAYWTNTGYKLR